MNAMLAADPKPPETSSFEKMQKITNNGGINSLRDRPTPWRKEEKDPADKKPVKSLGDLVKKIKGKYPSESKLEHWEGDPALKTKSKPFKDTSSRSPLPPTRTPPTPPGMTVEPQTRRRQPAVNSLSSQRNTNRKPKESMFGLRRLNMQPENPADDLRIERKSSHSEASDNSSEGTPPNEAPSSRKKESSPWTSVGRSGVDINREKSPTAPIFDKSTISGTHRLSPGKQHLAEMRTQFRAFLKRAVESKDEKVPFLRDDNVYTRSYRKTFDHFESNAAALQTSIDEIGVRKDLTDEEKVFAIAIFLTAEVKKAMAQNPNWVQHHVDIAEDIRAALPDPTQAGKRRYLQLAAVSGLLLRVLSPLTMTMIGPTQPKYLKEVGRLLTSLFNFTLRSFFDKSDQDGVRYVQLDDKARKAMFDLMGDLMNSFERNFGIDPAPNTGERS
ncbi:MAG: hypothetical protein EOO22_01130 [Comamonadaceae bacterium]|nr:MAG: hypothetical protein EOO22_01130 [Comamonadaceae bacterium]